MTQLIKNLETAFESKSKIDFLKKHYSGKNDIFFGVLPDTEDGRHEAHKIINEFLQNQKSGWKVGEVVDGKEIDLITHRVDQVQDWEMPDYLRQIEAPNVWETIEQMEERTGKKCSGSGKYYITVCVCRRFRNPLNNVPSMIDDEDEGWIPADHVKVADDIRDQI